MDDIAQELSISKKTIYQYFKDKEELVSIVAKVHLEKERIEIEQINKTAKNTMEEFILLSKCIKENHLRMNPVVFWDLKKYYHQAWHIFKEYKNGVFFESLRSSLKRGIEEGFFREDINIDVLAALRMEQIQMTYNEEIFPKDKYDIMEVQNQLFNHFVHGVLTQKGEEEFAVNLPL